MLRSAFLNELEKIAQYRKRYEHMLDMDIPLLRDLPEDVESAKNKLKSSIRRVKNSTWTHPMVAVHESKLNPANLGFKPTRLAIPLPGEKLFTRSWRAGKLHAHKMGPFFLVHQDTHALDDLASAISHNVIDAPKAIRQRLLGKAKIPVLSQPLLQSQRA